MITHQTATFHRREPKSTQEKRSNLLFRSLMKLTHQAVHNRGIVLLGTGYDDPGSKYRKGDRIKIKKRVWPLPSATEKNDPGQRPTNIKKTKDVRDAMV